MSVSALCYGSFLWLGSYLTGEAGPGLVSDDHTPSPIRQMDQGSNSEISSSAESERNTKLRHKLNLPFCVKQTCAWAEVRPRDDVRADLQREPGYHAPEAAGDGGLADRWHKHRRVQALTARLELAPSNEYDCFTRQGVVFILFRGWIWPAHFCILQPCPAWIQQNTDVYSLLGVCGLVISGVDPFCPHNTTQQSIF